MSSKNPVVPCKEAGRLADEQIDWHDKANSHFSKFCDASLISVLWNGVNCNENADIPFKQSITTQIQYTEHVKGV
jgi:hypothetical protein